MIQLLHPRYAAHQFLCLLLAALMVATPASLSAQEPAGAATPFDLGYALPDACVVIAVRPAQILTSPAAQLYPVEVLQAASIQHMGLDPLAAEQVVACISPPLAGPPNYSVVARFSAPVELKAGDHTQHTQPGKLNNAPYLQSMHPLLPSYYQPDGQTLVAMPDAALQQMAGAEIAIPAEALVSKFAAASRGDDLLAMVDLAPLRPLIAIGLAQAPLPPELNQLRDIPNLVKTITLRLNLTRPGITELVATANNDADAEQLVFMFESYKQQLAAQAQAQAEQALASLDPVEQAGGRYTQRMVKLADEQFQLVREGTELIVLRTDLHSDEGHQLAYLATIGMLVGLLLPAVQAAREAARRNSSMNNIKQINLGLLNHESARGFLPAHASYGPDGKPLLNWRVHILPFMEQQALYKQFHLDEPWDSEHNKALIAQMPALYLDPSSGLAPQEGKTHYLGVKGDGFVFSGAAEGRQLKDITDGMSNTIAVVQVDDEHAVPWTKPEDFDAGGENPLAGIGQLRPGVFLAGFCDGHVSAIAHNIDPAVFKWLLTIEGGEVINADP